MVLAVSGVMMSVGKSHVKKVVSEKAESAAKGPDLGHTTQNRHPSPSTGPSTPLRAQGGPGAATKLRIGPGKSTLAGDGIVEGAGQEHLDGQLTLQFLVVRAIHRAHAASAKPLDDVIASDLLARGNGHASRHGIGRMVARDGLRII